MDVAGRPLARARIATVAAMTIATPPRATAQRRPADRLPAPADPDSAVTAARCDRTLAVGAELSASRYDVPRSSDELGGGACMPGSGGASTPGSSGASTPGSGGGASTLGG